MSTADHLRCRSVGYVASSVDPSLVSSGRAVRARPSVTVTSDGRLARARPGPRRPRRLLSRLLSQRPGRPSAALTPSVSRNDPGVVACIDICRELRERSANVHARPALFPRVVTQLDTQPLTMP
jgi:hypothetical protein